MNLNVKASDKVIKNLSDKLKISKTELAEGILSIINAKMADAIRTITVKEGIDPREFSLVAFGGAGSMHAVWLAEELEIKEVIVPNDPGTFSAWGMLQTDIRRDLTVNFFQPFQGLSKEKIIETYNKLEAEAADLLVKENVNNSDMSFMLTADMRYIGQEYYVNVPIKLPINLEEINKNFHFTYEQQYGHSTPEGPCEFINLRLIAVGKILKSESMKSIDKKNIKEKSSRKITFNKKNYETDILDRQIIGTKEKFVGPIVIEEETATTVIPPNYSLIKDDYGNLIINKN